MKDFIEPVFREIKVGGYLTNICQQCGRKFKVAWYEGESSEKAVKDYICYWKMAKLYDFPPNKTGY